MSCKSYAVVFITALIQCVIRHGSADGMGATLTARKPEQRAPMYISATNTSAKITQNPTCPPWFINASGDCECNSTGIVSCDKDTNKSYIMVCYCMTYSNGTATVGHFYHSCFLRTRRYTNLIPLPSTTQKLDKLMCRSIHRRGQLCSSCQQNHTPPVYSYYLGCVYCPEGTSNWIKYILAAFLPLTVFCIGMLLFRISATSGYLAAFILFAQGLACPLQLRAVVAAQNYNRLPALTTVAIKLLLSLYSIWNLDFFRIFYSPFCLYAGIDTLPILALDYVIAIYPLFLVLVTYILVQLHARGFRVIVWLWKPFHFGISRIRKQWDAKTSLIDAFATFLLLSHVKIISVSFDLLVPNPVYFINGTRLPNLVLYYDASVEYFGAKHLPYGLLALAVFSVFVVTPLLLLFIYPCQCFQKLLMACNFRCFALHTFMDAFQGPFKNGTNKTRDCRCFAGVFLLVRIVMATVVALNINNGVYAFVSLAWLCFTMSIAAFKPFKAERCNSVTTVLLLIYAVGCTALQYRDQPSFEKGYFYAHLTNVIVAICITSPLVYVTALILISMLRGDGVKCIFHRVRLLVGKIQCCKRNPEQVTDSLPHRVTHEHQYKPLLSTTECLNT